MAMQSIAKNILRHHKMTALNTVVGGTFAFGTYDEARQSGDGVVSSDCRRVETLPLLCSWAAPHISA